MRQIKGALPPLPSEPGRLSSTRESVDIDKFPINTVLQISRRPAARRRRTVTISCPQSRALRAFPALPRTRVFVPGGDRIIWRVDIAPERRRSGNSPSRTACAAAATAAAAASSGKSCAGHQCSGAFFVEDIECRQADLGDLLLTESGLVARSGVPRRNIRCRSTDCGRSARQRQRQPGGPQDRDDLRPTLSFQSLLRVRHRKDT
jgi:hypothetical protein